MAIISVETPKGIVQVEIKGNTPDAEEQKRIRQTFFGEVETPAPAPKKGFIQQEVEDIKTLGKGIASVGDNIINMLPGVVNMVAYPLNRATGMSPEQASQANQNFAQTFSDPIGRLTGITQDPAYQNEASRRALNYIGEKVQAGAQAGAQYTGMPEQDVQNMMEWGLAAAGPKGVKATQKVASTTARVAEATAQTAKEGAGFVRGTAQGIAEMGQGQYRTPVSQMSPEAVSAVKPVQGQTQVIQPGMAGRQLGNEIVRSAPIAMAAAGADALGGSGLFSLANAANRAKVAKETFRDIRQSRAQTKAGITDNVAAPVAPVAPKQPAPLATPIENTVNTVQSGLGANATSEVLKNTTIKTRAEEIFQHNRQQGIQMDRRTATQQARADYDAYAKQQETQIAANKKAETERLAAEKAQKQAEFDASPEGQAIIQNKQEFDTLMATNKTFKEVYNRPLTDMGYREKMDYQTRLENDSAFRNDILKAAEERAQTVDIKSDSKAQEILQMIRNRGVKDDTTPSAPIEPVAPPALPADKTARSEAILDMIRQRQQGQNVPPAAEIPVEAPKPVVETPVAPTRPTTSQQMIPSAKKPTSLEEIRSRLKAQQATDLTPEQIAAVDKQTQVRENRSLGQQQRRQLEQDIKDYTFVESKKGVMSFNKGTLKDLEGKYGIQFDWKTAPNISKMGKKDAKNTIIKWAKEQVKNYDPANPPTPVPNPAKDLFGFQD